MTGPFSVVVERGGVVESRHVAHAVAVRGGAVVDAAGEPGAIVFMRSAAKPLQALPLVLDAPDLPDAELAIACASHEAEDEQIAAVRSLLERSRATEEDLECGSERGSKLAHNCSGKHAGMLLRCERRGWTRTGYRLAEHPLQQDVRRVVAEATGVPADEIPLAVDGCGVTTFAVPLRALAHAFSRLAGAELRGSDRVVTAMTRHPNLVGGPTAADTALMRALPGAVAKRGAEGVLCAGLPDGMGVAVKVEDGANRAAGLALAGFLGLEQLAARPVDNSRGEEVGQIFSDRGKSGSGFPQVI